MKIFTIVIVFLCLIGCGVKGKPVPPKTQPLLSNGKMSINKQKTANKKITIIKDPEETDWNESSDFIEEQQEGNNEPQK